MLAKAKKFKRLFLPKINAQEASVIAGLKIYPVSSLLELIHHLAGDKEILCTKHTPFSRFKSTFFAEFDMADVAGQELVKRALEIAAAGGHNIFLKGPPGAGKTMLARAIPGILPDLTENEALEVTKIYSVTGNLPSGESVIKHRPFRSPHHTISRIGLIGGGSRPMPGEISLAHRGVLFLDEFPEFPRSVLEAMRQPIEDGVVTVSRAAGTLTFPAKFILVAASNPCPCGYFGDTQKQCTCLPGSIQRYQKRLSGPILDRIDLHLEVPAVKIDKLVSEKGRENRENSKTIKKRVQKARDLQTKRFRRVGLNSNAEMSTRDVKEFCVLSAECQTLLKQAAISMNLSARSYFRVIKVARTIADLENAEKITPTFIAEALQYRPKSDP